MHFKFILALSATLCLSACATVEPPKTRLLTADQFAASSSRTLKTVVRQRAGLVPMRASSAMFGAIGGLAMANSAQVYASDHGINDPAIHIQDRLAQRVHERFGNPISPTPHDMTAPADPAKPAQAEPDSIYVSAVTYLWFERYLSFDWSHFALDANVMIALVDGSDNAILAKYDCKKSSKETHTLAELEADHGALANKILNEMGDACVSEFEAANFGAAPALTKPAT